MSSDSTEVTPSKSEEKQTSHSDPKPVQNDPEETENLPHTRGAFVGQLLDYASTIYEQQKEIEEGRQLLDYLLNQMSDVLKEKAKLYRQIQEVREILKVKDKKKLAITMTRKEVKARFDKSDQMLKKTMNQNENTKTIVENNLEVCGKLSKEVKELENENKIMSEVLCNSVTDSAKMKIVELNERIEGFHKLTEEEYNQKLDKMDKEIEGLTEKVDDKDVQESVENDMYSMRYEEAMRLREEILKKRGISNTTSTKKRNASPRAIVARGVNLSISSSKSGRSSSTNKAPKNSSKNTARKPFKKPSLDPSLFNFPKRRENEESTTESDEKDNKYNNSKNQDNNKDKNIIEKGKNQNQREETTKRIKNRTPQTARNNKDRIIDSDDDNLINIPQTTRVKKSGRSHAIPTAAVNTARVKKSKKVSSSSHRSLSQSSGNTNRSNSKSPSRTTSKIVRRAAPIIIQSDDEDMFVAANNLPPPDSPKSGPGSPKIGPESPIGSLILFRSKPPRKDSPTKTTPKINEASDSAKKLDNMDVKKQQPRRKSPVKKAAKKTNKKRKQQNELIEREAEVDLSEISNVLGKFNESENFSFDNDDFDPLKPNSGAKVEVLSESDSLDLEKMQKGDIIKMRQIERNIRNIPSEASNCLLFEGPPK